MRVILIPNARKPSRAQRRKNAIDAMSKYQPTQQDLDAMQREHFHMVNGGYYND